MWQLNIGGCYEQVKSTSTVWRFQILAAVLLFSLESSVAFRKPVVCLHVRSKMAAHGGACATYRGPAVGLAGRPVGIRHARVVDPAKLPVVAVVLVQPYPMARRALVAQVARQER